MSDIEAKNKWLATEVMKFDVIEVYVNDVIATTTGSCRTLKTESAYGTQQNYITFEGWNPFENIEQAFMLLDTFRWVDLEKDICGWQVSITVEGEGLSADINDSLELAIFECVLDASGFYSQTE